MTLYKCIKGLETRLQQADAKVCAIQVTLAAILTERAEEKKCFDDQEMVMRDHFASSALNGLVMTRATSSNTNYIVKRAYEIADAMITARVTT